MTARKLSKREKAIVAVHYAREDAQLKLARIQNGKHPDYQNGTARRHGEMTLRQPGDVADEIAHDLFTLVRAPTPCQRIQFLGGSWPDNEIPQGGLCESALAGVIRKSLNRLIIFH